MKAQEEVAKKFREIIARVKFKSECPECNGRGEYTLFSHSHVCKNCSGRGTLWTQRKSEFNIFEEEGERDKEHREFLMEQEKALKEILAQEVIVPAGQEMYYFTYSDDIRVTGYSNGTARVLRRDPFSGTVTEEVLPWPGCIKCSD